MDDGGTVPWPPLQGDPRPLSAFLARIGEVRDGATVYVKTDMLDAFFALAWPRIEARIVLVTAGEDWSSPAAHARWLDDPRIIRWFGQNCDLEAPHPKYEPMPIGFGDPHLPHGDQAALLRVHRAMRPVTDKPLLARATFHLTHSHPERRAAHLAVRDLPGVVLAERRVPPELLWIRLANFAFEISPRGSGPDCHRTWEALLMRSIPIVRRSRLDPLHEGWPVAIVREWREITPENMALWRERFAESFTMEMFTRLTRDYWTRRFRAAGSALTAS